MDTFQRWITLGSAVVAAISSVWSLWRSFHQNCDDIKVGFGPLAPPVSSGDWLYVVSRSDHLVTLSDYGFLDKSGALLSLPDLETNHPGDSEWGVRGKSVFDRRGAVFEIGPVQLRDDQIGAYAKTAGRHRYTLGFNDAVPWWRRAFIRIRIRWWRAWQ